ncbi:MAG: queuosine precursor transporter [Gordonibacter sp.]
MNRAQTFGIAFVAATMVANIMSLRMVAPLGVVMDAGTLLYPVTFILRDALHRRAGLKAANRTVTASVVCNVAMFALFAFAAWLPYDPSTGEQAAFGAVLLPGFLVVAGSVAGQFVSERIDGRIFHRIYNDGEGSHAKAALASNVVSIPIDTAIMCCIAFGLTIPLDSLASTIGANIAVKYAVMLASVAVYMAATKRR